MESKIIDEQLEDNQQIVTYKYLTQKLNVHPNKAKQLLKNYVSKLPDNKKYSVTIVMGGTLKENEEFCIVLAYDNHVETMRRRFKQIDFEHLYSVQPISRLSDINNALYLIDHSQYNYTNIPSSIKKGDKRNIPVQKQSVDVEMEIDSPSAEETKLDKTQEKKTGLHCITKNNNIKPEAVEKKNLPKKTNSDFFNKFKKSNNTDNTNTDLKNKDSVDDLTKVNNKKLNVESPKKNIKEHLDTEHNSKDKKKSNKKIDVINKLSIKNEQENTNGQEVKIKNKSNKKRENGNKSKSKNNQKVKRKRIQTYDSSDEEIDSEEEDKKRSENVMDIEDEVDIVQPTPPRPTLRENRKKEKQTSTSTYIDDDGFVCTTKEVKMVEMECEPAESEELNTEPPNKKIKSRELDSAVQDKKKSKNKQIKNISNPGLKQSSLNSFFLKQNK